MKLNIFWKRCKFNLDSKSAIKTEKSQIIEAIGFSDNCICSDSGNLYVIESKHVSPIFLPNVLFLNLPGNVKKPGFSGIEMKLLGKNGLYVCIINLMSFIRKYWRSLKNFKFFIKNFLPVNVTLKSVEVKQYLLVFVYHDPMW